MCCIPQSHKLRHWITNSTYGSAEYNTFLASPYDDKLIFGFTNSIYQEPRLNVKSHNRSPGPCARQFRLWRLMYRVRDSLICGIGDSLMYKVRDIWYMELVTHWGTITSISMVALDIWSSWFFNMWSHELHISRATIKYQEPPSKSTWPCLQCVSLCVYFPILRYTPQSHELHISRATIVIDVTVPFLFVSWRVSVRTSSFSRVFIMNAVCKWVVFVIDAPYRVAKNHRIPYLYSFGKRALYFSGSFVENDLHLTGSYESSPPCMDESASWNEASSWMNASFTFMTKTIHIYDGDSLKWGIHEEIHRH